VPRHHGVAASAHRDVQRRARPARVGETRGEADLVDESLRLEGAGDLPGGFAPPALVAVLLDVVRNLIAVR